MTKSKLKTIGIDEETHKLLKKIQSNIYGNINVNYELKKIVYLLIIDPEKAEDLIIGNLTV